MPTVLNRLSVSSFGTIKRGRLMAMTSCSSMLLFGMMCPILLKNLVRRAVLL